MIVTVTHCITMGEHDCKHASVSPAVVGSLVGVYTRHGMKDDVYVSLTVPPPPPVRAAAKLVLSLTNGVHLPL